MLNAKREEPSLRVGIISDICIAAENSTADSVFVNSLQYFRTKDVDAVIIVGNFVRNGTENELGKFAKLWFSVFPDDKGLKGKHVERMFIYGENEIVGHTNKSALSYYSAEFLEAFCISKRQDELWGKYFHEPFRPIYRKDIKGYTFIGSHYTNNGVADISEFIKAEESDLTSQDKPFFYIQYKHPAGTVPWEADNGNNTPVLEKYPNMVCFSGHSRISLTDENSIWQGSFTNINVGSLHQVKLREGRDISAKIAHSHQGILMNVFANKVEIDRYDFHNGESLGIWNIPTDINNRPYDPTVLSQQGSINPPTFPSKSSVTVERKKGKNRGGAKVKQVYIHFPAAISRKGRPRALDYEISVELMSYEVALKRRVCSQSFYMSERADKENGVRYAFPESELPKGAPFRFVIKPIDSFDNYGEAIYTEYLVIYEND